MPRNQEQWHITCDHDFYVIGFIEGGQRHLWCKGRESCRFCGAVFLSGSIRPACVI